MYQASKNPIYLNWNLNLIINYYPKYLPTLWNKMIFEAARQCFITFWQIQYHVKLHCVYLTLLFILNTTCFILHQLWKDISVSCDRRQYKKYKEYSSKEKWQKYSIFVKNADVIKIVLKCTKCGGMKFSLNAIILPLLSFSKNLFIYNEHQFCNNVI